MSGEEDCLISMLRKKTLKPLIKNPKRDDSAKRGRASWYPYYAGYSPSFASALLSSLGEVGASPLIFDPWNGAGTTTSVAAELGFRGVGLDANPVMAVVAKGKLLDSREQQSLVPLAEDLVNHASTAFPGDVDRDPLTAWLDRSTTAAVRRLETALRGVLVPANAVATDIDHLSTLAAFYYTALFRTNRELLKSLQKSNPTWFPRSVPTGTKISASEHVVVQTFLENASAMAEDVARHQVSGAEGVSVRLGRSEATALPDSSVDVVLSSPPYCTRIDYAVATRPELAVMGIPEAGIEDLRRGLMGSTTVGRTHIEALPTWGSTCMRFLEAVSSHPSKASSTYYYKSHVQYFSQLYESLTEVTRVVKPGGLVFLVVQDSYYKTLRNDLATIVIEMLNPLGLQKIVQRNFFKRFNMGRLNRRAMQYQLGTKPVESVIGFIAA